MTTSPQTLAQSVFVPLALAGLSLFKGARPDISAASMPSTNVFNSTTVTNQVMSCFKQASKFIRNLAASRPAKVLLPENVTSQLMEDAWNQATSTVAKTVAKKTVETEVAKALTSNVTKQTVATVSKVAANVAPKQGLLALARQVVTYIGGQKVSIPATLALGYQLGRFRSKKEEKPQTVINNSGPSFFDENALLAASTALAVTYVYRATKN
jgi:hypothetical protein